LAANRTTTEDAPVAPQLSAEQFAQLLQAISANKQTLDADTLANIMRETATISAQSMQKALKPENTDHPGISVFSHPKGDKAMPKPTLPYELFWNGYPVHKFPETETWSEWMAQSNVPPPGVYTVLRNDASRMAVTVETEYNADGKPTKVRVTHPHSREDKDKIPAKTVILAQMHGKDDPKTAFIAAMQQQIASMFGES
jgi:hypothetical protein